MIRVELVGGAKKLFAQSVININRSDVSLDELVRILQNMQVENSPKLDLRNTLVAINGADTSAIGGTSSMVRDNDVVSIIPIVHGGSGSNSNSNNNSNNNISSSPTTTLTSSTRITIKLKTRRFDIIGIRGNTSVLFLDKLRTSHPKTTIQIISAKYVLNETHARKILFLSSESQKRNIMLAKKIETDILMRFAITTQISIAIKDAGISQSSRHSFVLVSTGAPRYLDSLYNSLDNSVLSVLFTSDYTMFLKKRFKITQRAINSTISNTPLEDILAERAAVLSSDVA